MRWERRLRPEVLRCNSQVLRVSSNFSEQRVGLHWQFKTDLVDLGYEGMAH
jgi:hypothetical protein